MSWNINMVLLVCALQAVAAAAAVYSYMYGFLCTMNPIIST